MDAEMDAALARQAEFDADQEALALRFDFNRATQRNAIALNPVHVEVSDDDHEEDFALVGDVDNVRRPSEIVNEVAVYVNAYVFFKSKNSTKISHYLITSKKSPSAIT